MKRQVAKLKQQALQLKQSKATDNRVPKDIVEYAKFRGYTLTPDQINVVNSVLSNKPTIAAAAHAVGKSCVSAILAAWFFETHPDGIGLITAPTNKQITQIIFKELRRVLPNCRYFAPKANNLQRSSSWWVAGIANKNADSWQGKHADSMLIILDECTSVDQVFWDRSHTMFEAGRKNHYFLAIGNPYTQSSPMYLESLKPMYNTIQISALNHPNVVNKKDVIPGAISYNTVLNRIKDECRIALPHEMDKAFDFEGSRYISQSPLFDVQILGQYPQQSDYSLWNQTDLDNLLHPIPDDPDYQVVISCDPARYGSCATVIMVRRGPNIVEMQSYIGLGLDQTSDRIKELCNKYGSKHQRPTNIPVHIDGCGLGVGLIDMAGTAQSRYNFIEVLNSHKADENLVEKVNNRRTQLWMQARNYARAGQLSIAMLPHEQQQVLLRELRMPEFFVNLKGQIQLEPKEKIIKRLGGRSPDHADALSLVCITPAPTYESHF